MEIFTEGFRKFQFYSTETGNQRKLQNQSPEIDDILLLKESQSHFQINREKIEPQVPEQFSLNLT